MRLVLVLVMMLVLMLVPMLVPVHEVPMLVLTASVQVRESEEEIEEGEEEDRVRYRDCLATVGALARECLPLSLPLLYSLLEGRTARCALRLH